MSTEPKGWVRGDSGAARYLDMDRKTWVRLRRRANLRPAIVGKSRRFEVAALDRLMRSLVPASGAMDILRPSLSAKNRGRAAAQQLSTPSPSSKP